MVWIFLSFPLSLAVSVCDVAIYRPTYHFKAVAAAEYEIGPRPRSALRDNILLATMFGGRFSGPLPQPALSLCQDAMAQSAARSQTVRVVTGALEHDV